MIYTPFEKDFGSSSNGKTALRQLWVRIPPTEQV